MNKNISLGKWAGWSAATAIVTLGVLSTALGGPPARFTVVELVTDDQTDFPGAGTLDPLLVNAWGLAVEKTGIFRVANNGSATSTQYDGDGNQVLPPVSVPGAPSGLALNDGTGFVITSGTSSAPAQAIFASEDGTISAWSPAVPPGSTEAIVVIDNSATGAVYKGLTIAHTSSGDRLYATDFHNAKVNVFDDAFHPVIDPDAFVDTRIPAGFAPFGIRAIEADVGTGGADMTIFVTYAKQDAAGKDDVAGQGLGFVDAFDVGGNFVARIAARDQLNSPWGLALAPAGFGSFGGALLVGNFGDGTINAYNLRTHKHRGTLRDSKNKPITIDGLWGLEFGNGVDKAARDHLYFTSGPGDEAHGLFGFIQEQ